MGENKNRKWGIVFIISSAFCFALMNLFIRESGDVPVLQKVFFRNFFAMLVAFFSLFRTRTKFTWKKGSLKYLIGRSLGGAIGMLCNFYAVDNLAISDAAILNKLSPFFAILFSMFLLREFPNSKEILSVCLAFLGAIFVVKPTMSMEVIPALAGVIGGLGAGLAYTYVRKLGLRQENSMVIVAFFSAFTCLLFLPNLIINYAPMTPRQWGFLVLTGIAAAGGQIFITKAYRAAPAKEISVYDFSIVLFTAILGFFFLDQVPDILSFIGYFIIIGTAIWFRKK